MDRGEEGGSLHFLCAASSRKLVMSVSSQVHMFPAELGNNLKYWTMFSTCRKTALCNIIYFKIKKGACNISANLKPTLLRPAALFFAI